MSVRNLVLYKQLPLSKLTEAIKVNMKSYCSCDLHKRPVYYYSIAGSFMKCETRHFHTYYLDCINDIQKWDSAQETCIQRASGNRHKQTNHKFLALTLPVSSSWLSASKKDAPWLKGNKN